MKKFSELKESEVLALAISSEEEDAQIYANFANRLREEFPSTAQMFDGMVKEEQVHKNRLLELYRQKFGDRMPYITRQDVRGFMKRKPIWLMEQLRIDAVRRQASVMEAEAFNFYTRAAERAQDVDVRKLLGDLALEESGHGPWLNLPNKICRAPINKKKTQPHVVCSCCKSSNRALLA